VNLGTEQLMGKQKGFKTINQTKLPNIMEK
jgi:hypothetical protein